jgi:hypothetical protein
MASMVGRRHLPASGENTAQHERTDELVKKHSSCTLAVHLSGVGVCVRMLIVAIASLGLFATALHGADMSPLVGQFPDTEDNLHVYLFVLKKNGISYKKSGMEFCDTMKYGRAVLENQPKVVEGDNAVPGELEWVICRFKGR